MLPHTSAKPESLKDSTYGVGANPTRVIHTNGAVVLDFRRRNENSKADNPMLFAGSRVQEKPQPAQGVHALKYLQPCLVYIIKLHFKAYVIFYVGFAVAKIESEAGNVLLRKILNESKGIFFVF